ncbi:MAG TPA: hypothetical protein VIV60_20890 [Polyangiaceae bacterium]
MSAKYLESMAQAKYLESVRMRLESVLTTPVELKSLGGAILTDAAQLGPLWAGSNLHILQIDEFQLPVLKGAMLHPFRRSLFDRNAGSYGNIAPAEDVGRIRWAELTDEVREMVTLPRPARDGSDYVVAVPYYRNLGLLTVQLSTFAQKEVSATAFNSWRELCEAAQQYNSHRDDGMPLFFEFSRRVDEDYCCLFLEMLLGNAGGALPEASDGLGGLKEWISTDAFRVALGCFHVLGHPAYMKDRGGQDVHVTAQNSDSEELSILTGESPSHFENHRLLVSEPTPVTGSRISAASALITRQWYTNLSMATRLQVPYKVVPLPGGVSISGEWYLGVGAHSAVPELGFRIILDELTSRKAEFARMRLGIGLPVTAQFYRDHDADSFFPPHVEISKDLALSDLIRKAQRRSRIYQYHLLAPILSKHLQDLLGRETPDFSQTVRRLVADTEVVFSG